MYTCVLYSGIVVILICLELLYFAIAKRFNIIDKPNERSSHSNVVLRGGGILFPLAALLWAVFAACGLVDDVAGVSAFLPFIVGLVLISGVSFVDDIVSLPDSVRLLMHFVSYVLMLWSLGMFGLFAEYGLMVGVGVILMALIVVVGASNVINFMDGINGITGIYALASLVPLALLNGGWVECGLLEGRAYEGFASQSMIYVLITAVMVFGVFNFRPKGRAKCFAGDVGSIGIAYILLYLIGGLVMRTGDITYLIFLLVYGVDGCLTICHRIMLHENLGVAHRKHAYQIMANELKIGHIKVALLYGLLQLLISMGFVYVCPIVAEGCGIQLVLCHWLYLIVAAALLALAYLLFMKKYYYLHEEYLESLKKK